MTSATSELGSTMPSRCRCDHVIRANAGAARNLSHFGQALLDLKPLLDALRKSTAAFLRALQRSSDMHHGAGNYDRTDRTWQTDMCAAWLCSSCPAPTTCDHTCHGGTRR